ncbi:MAG: hypothetical protein IJ125_00640 [Atopobiaceae bacterium]|nr:hypothetical protein [Atopobiaceae bacterium]
MLVSWLSYAAASDPDKLPYDLSFWRSEASVVGTALTGWLISKRSKAALPVAAATVAATGVLGALNEKLKGSYVTRTWDVSSWKEKAFNKIMPAVHVASSAVAVGASAYVRFKKHTIASDTGKAMLRHSALSRLPVRGGASGASGVSCASGTSGASGVARASGTSGASGASGVTRASGTSGASGASGVARALRQAGNSQPLSTRPWYPLVRKLALYYMPFSILGHWGEMLFCTGIKYGVFQGGYDRNNHMLWDQWLFPFPAEGTAAVLAELFLLPAKEAMHNRLTVSPLGSALPKLATTLAILGSFAANLVVCTGIDYGTGMVANRNFELWDYRDMPFNFRGQVCLQNSLFYTAVATLAIWGLLPLLDSLIDSASDDVLDGSLVGMGSFFAFLELLYHVLPRSNTPEA